MSMLETHVNPLFVTCNRKFLSTLDTYYQATTGGSVFLLLPKWLLSSRKSQGWIPDSCLKVVGCDFWSPCAPNYIQYASSRYECAWIRWIVIWESIHFIAITWHLRVLFCKATVTWGSQTKTMISGAADCCFWFQKCAEFLESSCPVC